MILIRFESFERFIFEYVLDLGTSEGRSGFRTRNISRGKAAQMFSVGNIFPGLGGGSYEANYRAYPVAFIEKDAAEEGDKVILPPSALEKLGVSNCMNMLPSPVRHRGLPSGAAQKMFCIPN